MRNVEKVLKFFANNQKGQKSVLYGVITMGAMFMIGLLLCMPVFWMGRQYSTTWMNEIAPYFFIPFGVYAIVFLFIFVPYLWYVGNSHLYQGDGRGLLRGMSMFCSIAPGAIIYRPIFEALYIPYGGHNVVGMLLCGVAYLVITSAIFKKVFATAQKVFPLC